jgi:hypothetical protein
MNPAPKAPAWYLLSRHWLSLAGVALIAIAGTSLFFVGPHGIRGHASNPYAGIVVFLVVPAIFFTGLLLIPLGIYLSKREIRRGLAEASFDRGAAVRRLALFLAVTTALCVVIGSQLTYRAVGYMETPQFCGATCHSMKPELAAYANSPHSRVECVDCHVAPGAAGWIESKKNGIRQLVEVVFKTEPKPIPSALESNRLVPARAEGEGNLLVLVGATTGRDGIGGVSVLASATPPWVMSRSVAAVTDNGDGTAGLEKQAPVISYGAYALRNAKVKAAYDSLTGGGTAIESL